MAPTTDPAGGMASGNLVTGDANTITRARAGAKLESRADVESGLGEIRNRRF
jgi:hypothetical protein